MRIVYFEVCARLLNSSSLRILGGCIQDKTGKYTCIWGRVCDVNVEMIVSSELY
jgi:hypothetical protein